MTVAASKGMRIDGYALGRGTGEGSDLPAMNGTQKRCLVRTGIWPLIELYQMLENIFRDLPKPLKGEPFLPPRTVNPDPPLFFLPSLTVSCIPQVCCFSPEAAV